MSKVKVGVSRVITTPPMGTPMSGYFTPRYAKGVRDNLTATAVAFDDGKKRAVVIGLDQAGFKNQYLLDRYKQMISEFCDVPLSGIIINCSHTHTGPILGFDKSSGVDSNHTYDDWIGYQLRDAAYFAFQDLKSARFFVAEHKAKDIAFIRIFRMKDGSFQTNPGVGNPDVVEPLGEINDTAKILRIEREDGKDVIMVNFGMHADTIGGEIISADFPGVMRKIVEKKIEDSVCVFVQGAEGDVNHVNVFGERKPKGYHYSQDIGKVLADAVCRGYENQREIEVDEVSFANKKIQIPANKEDGRIDEAKRIVELHRAERDDEIDCGNSDITTVVAEAIRIVNLFDAPQEYEFTITTIGLGDFAFAGIPGEPFCEIGKRIISDSPFENTFVCVLCDGGEIYFPTSRTYEGGGYEARSSVVKCGADNIIVDETVKLLNTLRREEK